MLLHLVRRQSDRTRDDLDPVLAREDLGHALGHDHQQIGVGDDQPDSQVVGNMQRDPPRDPLLPERSLNDLVVTSSWVAHLDVCFREELRGRELGANARMILPRETDEALLEDVCWYKPAISCGMKPMARSASLHSRARGVSCEMCNMSIAT